MKIDTQTAYSIRIIYQILYSNIRIEQAALRPSGSKLGLNVAEGVPTYNQTRTRTS